jgi:uncharacterized repeat protein (TIGR03803 family)
MKKKLLFLSIVLALFLSNAKAQGPELWGMTYLGGDYNAGTIFKTDIDGNNQSVEHSLYKYEGMDPYYTHLCEASNGKLYGMTNEGGTNNDGVLFEYDPVINTYTKILDFDGPNNGGSPQGGLMQADNGKLYGMTRVGGTNNDGVLFEYDPATNTYTKKLDFDGPNNGKSPNGSLMQAANGKLYGMTYFGGTLNVGCIFEYDLTTNTCTKKLDFNYANGNKPSGSLIQADNGKLYGMTSRGGTNDKGVIFEYDLTTNTYTNKLDFNVSNNGKQPKGSLMQAANGKLYGMTPYGGTYDYGVLFEYDPTTATYTKKLDFDNANNGKQPMRSLMQAANGKLYSTASGGGANSNGVLFEYDPTTNTYTKKFDFDNANNGGSGPSGSLIQTANGNFYGLTRGGGTNSEGVLYEYALATNTYTKKLDFEGAKDGKEFKGCLMQAANGKLYGMTEKGGVNNIGVLFEYDPANNTYTKKLDFDGTNNGSNPRGSLMEATNGKLYGMTIHGGANNNGVLFEYNPTTNTYTKKLDFEGTNNGSAPFGSLMQAPNGKLYGMTYSGGTNSKGVLFEYDAATNTYTKKLDFDGINNGKYPEGSLMQADNGKLYGMTRKGGTNDLGVLFEYDPTTNTYTKKLDFANNGKFPKGSLMQADNGKLYGMTSSGGTNWGGVLFEYDPATNTYTKKLDFGGTDKGSGPFGSLMQASNGKLYGMTAGGGTNSKGVLFEYDPATDTYTKKLDFDGTNGQNPYYGHLIEVSPLSNDQQIELSEGYSFISSQIMAENPDMQNILQSNLTNLEFVRNSQGLMLRKIGPNWVNSIGNWVNTEGYLFKMSSGDNLIITGDVIDPQTPIELSTGYQIIGYLPDAALNTEDVFQNILENLEFVRNTSGLMLRKIGPVWVNSIGDMQPGEAYLVKMTGDDQLIYPEATKYLSGYKTATPEHFKISNANPNEVVWTLYFEANGLEAGDEIAVFDNENLSGAGVVNSDDILTKFYSCFQQSLQKR